MLKLFKLLLTHNPKKRFRLECQLMFDYAKRSSFMRKRFQRRLYYIYGCEISPSAHIDENVEFIHPLGIVIGSKAVVEEGCIIYQQVTLGSDFTDTQKMPYVKKRTLIGAGAKLIGGITIGENCIIGANAVVTRSVPDNSIVVGANKIRSRIKKV
ncbi:MAG: serine acetyltransferase [Helicobacteraceae bacterium]|jgi:serine O-acetyltransferase|nr:serine acetyltransferase [Helicobacteraceae bacterium]